MLCNLSGRTVAYEMPLTLMMCFSADTAAQHQDVMEVAMSQATMHLTAGTKCPCMCSGFHHRGQFHVTC